MTAAPEDGGDHARSNAWPVAVAVKDWGASGTRQEEGTITRTPFDNGLSPHAFTAVSAMSYVPGGTFATLNISPSGNDATVDPDSFNRSPTGGPPSKVFFHESATSAPLTAARSCEGADGGRGTSTKMRISFEAGLHPPPASA